MCNTEYFELCEISSKRQCFDCSLYWEVGIVYCTCGKCMQPSGRNRQLNKARYDVLSIPCYVNQKNPTHGARHGPFMRQCMYYNAHAMLKKARKHKNGGYKNNLDRWNNDRRLGNRSFKTMKSHWKTIPKLLHNKKEVGARNHGNFF